MSIYRPIRRTDHSGIPADEAADVRPSAAHGASAKAQDWTRLRKAQPAEVLLPVGQQLLDRLPPEVRPLELAMRYPRIVNLIALHWNDRNICGRYFNGLLNDQRGQRQGFPQHVRDELLKLAEHWYYWAENWEA
jgi:hypothetical protein